jgi:hypothetical protein
VKRSQQKPTSNDKQGSSRKRVTKKNPDTGEKKQRGQTEDTNKQANDKKKKDESSSSIIKAKIELDRVREATKPEARNQTHTRRQTIPNIKKKRNTGKANRNKQNKQKQAKLKPQLITQSVLIRKNEITAQPQKKGPHQTRCENSNTRDEHKKKRQHKL